MKQRLPLEIKTKISNTPGLLGCAENLLTWKAKPSWSILRDCKLYLTGVPKLFHPDTERENSVSKSSLGIAFPCSSLSDPKEWYMEVPGPDQGPH